MSWILSTVKGKAARSRVLKTATTSTVYFIFQARNKKGHGDEQIKMDDNIDICMHAGSVTMRRSETRNVILRVDHKL